MGKRDPFAWVERFREVLSAPPSVGLFQTIVRELDTLTKEPEGLLDYLDAHLSGWSPSIRREIPLHWWSPHWGVGLKKRERRKLLEQGISPYCSLGNGLSLHDAEKWFYVLGEKQRIARFLDQDWVTGLKYLDLRYTRLYSSHWPFFEPLSGRVSLYELDIRYTHVGSHGLAMLAKHDLLRGLRVLRMQSCALGASAMQTLVEQDAFATLEHLDLRHNAIGEEGAKLLANEPNIRNLHTLHLSVEDTTRTGCLALALSDHLSPTLRLLFQARANA